MRRLRDLGRGGRDRPRPLRVLVHLPYPGYHRLYGSSVRELAGRGHDVLLSYDAEKQRSPAAEAVERTPGVRIVAPLPRRTGPLAELATRLRTGADYARYLDPRFASAPWLRERMERHLPDDLAFLRDAPVASGAETDTLLGLLRVLEERLPSHPEMDAALRELAPDVILVSPVLARGRSGVHQRDTVASARALGLPVGVGVASWDHLTSKGVLGAVPDAVYVWNAAQRDEAVTLHGVPAERVVITGAPAFDQWFGYRARVSRADFARAVGLDPAAPYVLYVGSSPNIAPVQQERAAVAEWAAALRASGRSELAAAGILVRPHPGNVAGWADADLNGLGNAAVSPRVRPDIVMDDAEEQHYFHSLHHSAAVVGVNTSAMVEAAIVGRSVHSYLDPRFAGTQQGTLHFRLLTPAAGGPVRLAAGLDEHFAQLAEAVADPHVHDGLLQDFVRSFVRPGPPDVPAGRVLAKAIERLAGPG